MRAQLTFGPTPFTRQARVSGKPVAGRHVGTMASGVADTGADILRISGYDGGPGASPRAAISFVGVPWELGLAETQAALTNNGLRRTVTLQTDGQLRTGFDIVLAALFGAEEFVLGAGPLVALGSSTMRVCPLRSSPAGIPMLDEKVCARTNGTSVHLDC